MNILIYNEGVHDKEEWMKKVYPDGIHGALKQALNDLGNITITILDDVEEIVTEECLNKTDVMLWWGHCAHGSVPDKVAELVHSAVLKGMGFIALHSAHLSKPLVRILGTSCTLKWRDDDRERIWVTAPFHPIAQGLPEYFELNQEEMYGEFFDIPKPDDVIFTGWFAGGEVFRSGCTFSRGYGRIFYFQPGHEAFPTYYNENVVKILKNAVKWASSSVRREVIGCPNVQSLETKQ